MNSSDTKPENFNKFLSSHPKIDIIIYTDGSKSHNSNKNGRYVIFLLGHQSWKNPFPIGRNKEEYDTEAHAALRGLQKVNLFLKQNLLIIFGFLMIMWR